MAKLTKAVKKAIMEKAPTSTTAELMELGIMTGEAIFLPPFNKGGEFGNLTIGEMKKVAKMLNKKG